MDGYWEGIALCKGNRKGKTASNFRPITFLPLLWKLLTAVLADELYRHLEENNLLPSEQKGCRKGSGGTKDQLLIDKMIVKNCKRRLTSLGVAQSVRYGTAQLDRKVNGDVWSGYKF